MNGEREATFTSRTPRTAVCDDDCSLRIRRLALAGMAAMKRGKSYS